VGQKYYKRLGGLMTFSLFTQKACFDFMDKLELVKRATNLNDNKSLIIHPASTIFSEYSPEIVAEMEITDTLIRFSVGLEDAEDIIADLEQALSKI
jgi:O-acetylhomoserine (thiol)-lyase